MENADAGVIASVLSPLHGKRGVGLYSRSPDWFCRNQSYV